MPHFAGSVLSIQPGAVLRVPTEELRRLLCACCRHLPGKSSGGIPGEVDDAGFDGLDRPSLGEGTTNLVLSHPARSPITGLAVAETEHVIAATRWKHCGKALDVTLALAVIENVKQPAVEHRLEPFAQNKEAKGVRHQESRLDACSAAFVTAKSMAFAERSTPRTSWPSEATRSACSPVPHPASSTLPTRSPALARRSKAGCGRPMSHGGGVSDA